MTSSSSDKFAPGAGEGPRNMSMVQPGTIIEGDPLNEQIFKYITYNDVPSLRQMFNTYIDPQTGVVDEINVVKMRDARKFTVLSYACYKNNEECFMILYDYALENNMRGIKSFEEKQKQLRTWANQPTDEDFTALHFATYHGNYNLIKFLIDTAHADIYKKNKFGSTVLHIAA